MLICIGWVSCLVGWELQLGDQICDTVSLQLRCAILTCSIVNAKSSHFSPLILQQVGVPTDPSGTFGRVTAEFGRPTPMVKLRTSNVEIAKLFGHIVMVVRSLLFIQVYVKSKRSSPDIVF